MTSIRTILPVLLGVFISHSCVCQSIDNLYPEIGQPCPDIELRNIGNYIKKSIKISELKGKWTILDFWHKYCSSCVASFPEVNELQKKYQGKIQYFLIGREDKENTIRNIYDRYRKKFNLDLAVVFDSGIHKQLGVGACPYIIIIDDKGIVKGITGSVSDSILNAFLHHQDPAIRKSYRSNEAVLYPYDSKKPFLINNNGGKDDIFISRSVLTKWNSKSNISAPTTIDGLWENLNLPKFEVLGTSLGNLYNYAFLGRGSWSNWEYPYGEVYSHPVLELTDKNLFDYEFSLDKNIFSYSVTLPPSQCGKENFQKALQDDLNRSFGYEAFIETRKMPYWSLTIDTADPNKHTGLFKPKKKKEFILHSTLVLTNSSLQGLVDQIWGYHQEEPPIINETGITQPIHIAEDVIMTNLEEVRQMLGRNGLSLVKSEKYMKVVIIRDRSQAKNLSKNSTGIQMQSDF